MWPSNQLPFPMETTSAYSHQQYFHYSSYQGSYHQGGPQFHDEAAARAKKAEYQKAYTARRRAVETEAERTARLEKQRLLSARYRANQSEEERARRLQYQREKQRKIISQYKEKHATESEEEKARRREKQRMYAARWLAKETEEKRKQRIERQRLRRQNESPATREKRLAKQREINNRYRLNRGKRSSSSAKQQMKLGKNRFSKENDGNDVAAEGFDSHQLTQNWEDLVPVDNAAAILMSCRSKVSIADLMSPESQNAVP